MGDGRGEEDEDGLKIILVKGFGAQNARFQLVLAVPWFSTQF